MCLDEWLKTHKRTTCPYCMKRVIYKSAPLPTYGVNITGSALAAEELRYPIGIRVKVTDFRTS